MKRASLFTALCAIVLLSSCASLWMSPKEIAEEEQRVAKSVQEQLDSCVYTIDVNYMLPFRGGAKAVDSYWISVDGDTLDSSLPYYGVAQTLPFGGGKGLSFTEKIEEYSDSGLQGESRTIVLKVRTEEDSYVYSITVFDNGVVDLHVHCRNRDDISFRGNLRVD